MKSTISTSQAKKMITDKLSHFFGVSPADATDEQFYKAVAMIVRDRLSAQNKFTICVWNFLWAVHSETIFTISALLKHLMRRLIQWA